MDPIIRYYLQIADNAYILSHRISENISSFPFLEEDIAHANVALDLLGLAEAVYEEAALLLPDTKNGDQLISQRTDHAFFHVNLMEQPNTDFAYIMMRQFFADSFHFFFFSQLVSSRDPFLAAIANKSLKEVTYHLRRSSEWIIRLGDGTQESNRKAQQAADELWKYTHEFFSPSEADLLLLEEKKVPELSELQKLWRQKVNMIFYIAKLKVPEHSFYFTEGKKGFHTEHLGNILRDIQFLPLRYPDAEW